MTYFLSFAASFGLALIVGGVGAAFDVDFPILTYVGTGCLGAVFGIGATHGR